MTDQGGTPTRLAKDEDEPAKGQPRDDPAHDDQQAASAEAVDTGQPQRAGQAATIPAQTSRAGQPPRTRWSTAGAGPDSSVRLSDGLRFGFLVFAAVWVGWGVLGVLGIGLIQINPPMGVPGLDADPTTPGWQNFLTVGNRADALWYQRIALEGYRPDDGSAAFFPLFPLLTHVLTVLGIPLLLAANLIAQGAFLGTLVVLYSLTAREFGVSVARKATPYLAVFPTAFFLLSPFTEPVFLLMVLLTFWYARNGRWWHAILPALLCGLARSAGVVVVGALLVEAAHQLHQRRGGAVLPRLLAALAPAAGLGLYLAYWAITQDDPLAPLRAQANWGREPTLPTTTIYEAVRHAYLFKSWWLLDLVVSAVPILAIVAGVRVVPLSYTVYGLGCTALPLCAVFASRPLMSVPRFVLVLFPAFWVLALAVERRWLSHNLVIGVFSAGFALMGLLYMNSYVIF